MKFLIVGGGFVGSAVACHLLEHAPSGSSIDLVNSAGALARGLAYGTNSSLHLLNVPAARMSWREQAPADFVTWLSENGHGDNGSAFVPRKLYGEYLASRLQERINAGRDIVWQHRAARVDSLLPIKDGGWSVHLSDGQVLTANQVILALGNFSPACPHHDLHQLDRDVYVDDPWRGDAIEALPADAPIAILGTGLTMLDLLVSLQANGHRGPVLALSRRGLLPQPHRHNELPPPTWRPPGDWLGSPNSLRGLVRAVREAVAQATATGHDWRDIWVALRPRTVQLWQGLSPRSQGQFLRHLQAFWDVHRHRAAPQALEALSEYLEDGRLQVAAGRLLSAKANGLRVELQWRPRHSTRVESFNAVRVFNCTGPSNRIGEDRSALFAQLQASGRLQPCPLGLGVHVDSSYRLLDAQGQPQEGLYYAGPMLKAQHWEATAVPELRQHAAAVAEQVLSQRT